MKLLICTQALDRNDPYLGFFHAWVAALAPRHESIEVLCLRVGEYSLPKNVRVHPLGRGRVMRLLQLIRLAWSLRHTYDAVFVHMSQEFLLGAGWLWTFLNKRTYLWRNHYAGSAVTTFAALLCDKVFYTSRFSYTARYKNARQMPVGVELLGVPAAVRKERSVLFLGRIAPSKRPEMLLDAAKLVAEPMSLTFVGPGDAAYIAELKSKAPPGTVLVPGVPHHETPQLFASHEVFVNAARSGMLDKTIFEAAAAGCVPLAASKDWGTLCPDLFFEDVESLAKKLVWFFTLPQVEQDRLRDGARAAATEQSLPRLVERLVEEMR